MGAARRGRRPRLRAALRRRRAEEEGRLRPEGEAEERRRAAARDGRGPRGRGDRLASASRCSSRRCRCAGWSSTRSRSGDRARARRDARHRRPARRRAGDAAHPRPALRLRGLARPLAEDHAGPFCRSRAVRRDAARRGARARADEVRRRRLLGRRRRPSIPARSTRASTAVDGKRVAQGRDFGRDGKLRTADAVQLDESAARGLAAALDGATSASPPSRRSRTRAARPRRS